MQGINAHLAIRTGEKMVAMGSLPKGGAGVDSERELMLEDARSISQGLWRMVRLAQRTLLSLWTVGSRRTRTGSRSPWRCVRPLRAYKPSALR
jgi:hypothetical protein